MTSTLHHTPIVLAVVPISAADHVLAERFAHSWNLPLLEALLDSNGKTSSKTKPDQSFSLLIGHDSIVLQPHSFRSGPITIDFTTGKSLHRLNHGGGRQQPMAKALGLGRKKRSSQPTINHICDATAGFGTDSWVLASLGCQVTSIERSPWLCEMLKQAVSKAAALAPLSAIAARMQVVQGDSTTELCGAIEASLDTRQGKPRFDAVYLDPMYPASQKSAAVKKQMQALHTLIGPDVDSGKLLDVALHTARYRVVVKRPKTAAPLTYGQVQPDSQVTSVNTRYDIYTPHNHSMLDCTVN